MHILKVKVANKIINYIHKQLAPRKYNQCSSTESYVNLILGNGSIFVW